MRLLQLIAAFAVFLPWAVAPSSGPSVVGWNDLVPTGEKCAWLDGDDLAMECQSAAYISQPYALDRPITVSVEVRGNADDRLWVGLALDSDVVADNRYAEAAIVDRIAPYWTTSGPQAAQLSTPADRCCETYGAVNPAEWHTLTVHYAAGRAAYTIKGPEGTFGSSVGVDLGPAAVVWLGCVAVDPGETHPTAKTRCWWRNLRVEQ